MSLFDSLKKTVADAQKAIYVIDDDVSWWKNGEWFFKSHRSSIQGIAKAFENGKDVALRYQLGFDSCFRYIRDDKQENSKI